MAEKTAPSLPRAALIALSLSETLTLGALIVPLIVGLPLKVYAVLGPHSSRTPEQALSLVTSIGAAAAIVGSILFGLIGDRLVTAMGTRAVLLPVGAIAGLASIQALTQAHSLAMVVVWWSAAQFSMNAAFSAIIGAIADTVPPSDRSRVASWYGAAVTASLVIGLGLVTWLPKSTFVLFQVTPLLALPTALVTAALIWRLPVLRATGAPEPEAPRWRSQFWLLVGQRFLTQTAYSLGGLYGVYYVVRRFAMAPDHAASVVSAVVATGGIVATLASINAGRWAARTGRSDLTMRVGVAAMTVGLVVRAFGFHPALYVVAAIVVGFGYGTYGAADLGLVVRVVPKQRAGRYLGFFNIAQTAPQSLAPAVGPWFLAIAGGDFIGRDHSQDFTALDLAAALVALLSLVAISRLRVRSAAQ